MSPHTPAGAPLTALAAFSTHVCEPTRQPTCTCTPSGCETPTRHPTPSQAHPSEPARVLEAVISHQGLRHKCDLLSRLLATLVLPAPKLYRAHLRRLAALAGGVQRPAAELAWRGAALLVRWACRVVGMRVVGMRGGGGHAVVGMRWACRVVGMQGGGHAGWWACRVVGMRVVGMRGGGGHAVVGMRWLACRVVVALASCVCVCVVTQMRRRAGRPSPSLKHLLL